MLKKINANINDIPSHVEDNEIDFKFWYIRGNDQERGNNKTFIFKGFDIDKVKFIKCLFDLGFRRYDIDNTIIFIQIVNFRVIRQVSKIKMQDFFFKELTNRYKDEALADGIFIDDLINYIYNRLNNLFNDELLCRLTSDHPIHFNYDRKQSKFLYFQNGFLIIKPDKIDFLNYQHLDGYIWESEIIQKDYKATDSKESVFSQFIKKVTSTKINNKFEYDNNRNKALQSIIGYNLHGYMEGKLKASIFTDSRISNDDEPNGRTGKTLFCKALGRVICNDPDTGTSSSWCEINGKDFDPKNKNKYQTANIDTKIIVINDIRRGFDFEILFNDITEGVQVERKNMHPFKIKPKIIITTNKTLKLDGGSSKDRSIEFEFGEYFNENHSPQDEFNHWFFTDWNEDEWSRFYNYMAECCKMYLLNGIIKANSINLHKRKLNENTSLEFIEWVESSDITTKIKQASLNEEYLSKNELYNDFISLYPDYNKLTRKRFSTWVEYYCKYSDKNYTIQDKKFLGKETGHGILIKIKQ